MLEIVWKRAGFILGMNGQFIITIRVGWEVFWCVGVVNIQSWFIINGQFTWVSTVGCLILDIRLKGMSGLELQRLLREQGNRTPVIMVSGHASEQVRADALTGGAAEFLVKPIVASDLISMVKRTLECESE